MCLELYINYICVIIEFSNTFEYVAGRQIVTESLEVPEFSPCGNLIRDAFITDFHCQ